MGMFELTALVVIGLFTGVVGGMLGVGGSIVMIPAMTEVLGRDQHLYQAAAMIVNFFVVVPAAWQHRRAKAIHQAAAMRMIPVAVVAVVVGVAVSELPFFSGEGEAHLRRLFGLFLLLVVGIDLYRMGRHVARPSAANAGEQSSCNHNAPPTWRSVAAVAIPTGLVAGLLGVGGGVLAVPLQRRLMKVPLRKAIANSATIIIATSFVGAILKNYAWITGHGQSMKSLVLAGIIIPMAILGSVFGSRLTHRLPIVYIKTAFFVLLLVAAVRLLNIFSAA